MSMLLSENEDSPSVIDNGVPECLILDSRKVVKQGLVAHVDDSDAVTPRVSYPASFKSHNLKVKYMVDEGELRSIKYGHGQIGFIRREAIQYSPGSPNIQHHAVIPVTAKHNLRRAYDEKTGLWADAQDASVFLGTKQPAEEKQLVFADVLNWLPSPKDKITLRNDYSWDFGVDVSFAKKIFQRKEGMTDEIASFSCAV